MTDKLRRRIILNIPFCTLWREDGYRFGWRLLFWPQIFIGMHDWLGAGGVDHFDRIYN